MRTRLLQTALPWTIAAGCAAAAAWLSLHRDATPPQAKPAATRTAPAVATTSAAPPLVPLRACLERLDVAQALLDRRRRDATAEDGPSAERAAACMRDPTVRERLDGEVRAAVERHVADDHERRARAREQQAALASALTKDVLGLTPEQSAWVGEYVCATRDLHRLLADEAASAAALGADAFDRARLQREELLGDLEKYLDADRYAKLRALGGISLLTDALDCR
ncbi:MAG: hypothetical protein AABZ30_15305 [Myxococcota bacterium]